MYLFGKRKERGGAQFQVLVQWKERDAELLIPYRCDTLVVAKVGRVGAHPVDKIGVVLVKVSRRVGPEATERKIDIALELRHARHFEQVAEWNATFFRIRTELQKPVHLELAPCHRMGEQIPDFIRRQFGEPLKQVMLLACHEKEQICVPVSGVSNSTPSIA